MKLGIVGLPNVGKSTLFNSLTRGKAEAANYPFCTIDPNVGIVPVPDERLTKLAALYDSRKITPAVIEFVDTSPISGKWMRSFMWCAASRIRTWCTWTAPWIRSGTSRPFLSN